MYMCVVSEEDKNTCTLLYCSLPSDSSCSSCSLTFAAGLVGGVLEEESRRLCLFSLESGDGWATSSPD